MAFTRLPGIEDLLADITRYPSAEKDGKLRSFCAQFEVWHWYCGEALKRGDPYLLNCAIANYTLFAGRIVLAANEMLYPYHKWFLRVLAQAERKPEGFVEKLLAVLQRKETAEIEALYQAMTGFEEWQDLKHEWPSRFMLDTELAWMRDQAPVGEL